MEGADLQDAYGLVGTVLEGQYRVDRIIGEGGFGVVYQGRHLSLDQPVAIKILKGLDGGDPKVNALILEKFRAEARLLYTLSQSSLNIVRALHFSATTTPSGAWAPFMVLEWLDGRSLGEDLADRAARRMGGRSIADALPILGGIAEGLSVAHRQQVAHRDVKPANVFLVNGSASEAPRVKVLDFGIAKILKESEKATTRATLASFTWLYAAPEQLDPRVGPTSLATDVYAFALIITEVLTGRTPLDAKSTVDIMHMSMDRERRPTPRSRGANVTDEIENICRRALAVNPAERFSNVPELWAAFSAAAKTRATTTMQQRVVTSAIPGVTVNPLAATGVAPSTVPGSNVPSSLQATATGRPSALPHSVPASMPAGRPSLPSAAQWTPPPPTPPGYGTPPMQQGWPLPPPMRPQWVQRLPVRPPESMSTTTVVTIVVFVILLFFSGSCAMCGACIRAAGEG